MREELISTVQRMVRLESVKAEPLPGKPFGANIDFCYRTMLDICEQLGFSTADFDGYAGHAEIGEGEKVIGILGHLDTVPFGEGWELEPCSGALIDGKIYGRGVMDDKGPLIACLFAVKALQKAGIPFSKRIRVIFGLDEESNWSCMDHYLPLAGEPDLSFTPDGAFPVIYGEKGLCTFSLNTVLPQEPDAETVLCSLHGGDRPNMVPDHCCAKLASQMDLAPVLAELNRQYPDRFLAERNQNHWVVETKGLSAHGSTPEKGINAVTLMMLFLRELDLSECVHTAVIAYLEKFAAVDGSGVDCALEDEISGALTMNVGVADYSESALRLVVNIRYPIAYREKEIYDRIRRSIRGTGYMLEHIDGKMPLYLDPHSPLVVKLMKAYEEVTGDYEHPPITIGGGTYARAVKNAVAFGPIFPGHPEVGHKKNEWASVDDLMMCAKVYAKALEELMRD